MPTKFFKSEKKDKTFREYDQKNASNPLNLSYHQRNFKDKSQFQTCEWFKLFSCSFEIFDRYASWLFQKLSEAVL